MTARPALGSASVIASIAPEAPAADRADRIRRLQGEARALARLEVEALVRALEMVTRLSTGVADAGEAVPPGVRDLARRLSEDLSVRARILEALASRG